MQVSAAQPYPSRVRRRTLEQCSPDVEEDGGERLVPAGF